MKKKIYSLIIITTFMLLAQIATINSAIHSAINVDETDYAEVCYSGYEWREF